MFAGSLTSRVSIPCTAMRARTRRSRAGCSAGVRRRLLSSRPRALGRRRSPRRAARPRARRSRTAAEICRLWPTSERTSTPASCSPETRRSARPGSSARASAVSWTAPSRPTLRVSSTERRVFEARQRLRQHRLERANSIAQTFALDDVQIRERDGAAGRVPGIRIAVAERAGVVVPQHGADTRAAQDGAEREVAGREPLRRGHEVGLDPEALGREPRPGATVAGDHLVGDQERRRDAAQARWTRSQ